MPDRGLPLLVYPQPLGTVPRERSADERYSKRDGVVRWQSCVVPYADNVEVPGTHVGLALNPDVYACRRSELTSF